jgi:hypothetical protein
VNFTAAAQLSPQLLARRRGSFETNQAKANRLLSYRQALLSKEHDDAIKHFTFLQAMITNMAMVSVQINKVLIAVNRNI